MHKFVFEKMGTRFCCNPNTREIGLPSITPKYETQLGKDYYFRFIVESVNHEELHLILLEEISRRAGKQLNNFSYNDIVTGHIPDVYLEHNGKKHLFANPFHLNKILRDDLEEMFRKKLKKAFIDVLKRS